MTNAELTQLRLASLQIANPSLSTPEEIVSSLGAMQAQDYPGALWSLGLRLPGSKVADIEQAIIDRTIIRTWPMRGTLHFVPAKDARWMLQLTATRAIAAAASRRRNLEIDDAVLQKTKALLINALSGGKCLTRKQLCTMLDDHGIPSAGQRGIHLLHHFAELALLCFGPHLGKEPTFVLLEEWLPKAPELSRDVAITELTRRYFTSHGPATERDFAGWSTLTLSDVRAGLAANADILTSVTCNDKHYWLPKAALASTPTSSSDVYLLPGFDEYMLGYKDRSPALALEHSQKIVPGNNGMFLSTIVVGGQVAGTWKRTIKKNSVDIALLPFVSLSSTELKMTKIAGEQYATFIGLPVRFV